MNQTRSTQERPLIRKLTVLLLLGMIASMLAACTRSTPPQSGAAPANPSGQAMEMLVGSCYTSSVLRYDLATGAFLGEFIKPHAGGLDCPEGEVVLGDDGSLYLTSFSPPRLEQPETGGVTNDQVLRFDARTGEYKDVFIGPSREMVGPHGLALDRNGMLFVGTRFNSSVLGRSIRDTTQTAAVASMKIVGTRNGIRDVADVAIGPDGSLYLASYATANIYRFDQSLQFKGVFVSGRSANLTHIHDILFGPDGNLYVSNHNGAVENLYDSRSGVKASDQNSVVRFDGKTGQFMDVFVSGEEPKLGFIGDMTFAPDGTFIVVDCQAPIVRQYSGTTGAFERSIIEQGSGGLNGATFILLRPKQQ